MKQKLQLCNDTFRQVVYLCCMLFTVVLSAQDLENIGSRTVDKIKNSPLKIQGGVSANSIFYNSNGRSAREPFTYFLQGNVNVGWLTFSMPLSYSITNQGSNLGYDTPFKFNRVSISPKYKWAQAHIGDIALTYSPYTLNAHQFTGGGIELTPKGGFSFSALGGRFLRATEDDGQAQTLPAFRRMGYGTKLGYEKDNYKLGLIGFYAKDNINSISAVPDDRDITPKENLVIGFNGEVIIAENYTLRAEYASTAITQDLRSETTSSNGRGIAGLLFDNRGSTEYYDAYNFGLDFNINNMQVGIGYERIDPGYETLGAYFFNNDFENITLNAARPFFKERLNLSFNVGYQRDNLEDQKTQSTNRFVGAVNAALTLSDKITITGAYSNFSTFTNQSLNQFDDINDSDLTDEDLEALDFKQLSQNANVNINWMLSQGGKSTQTINLNYNLAASANEQAGVIAVGQANNFHNANAVYTIGFPKSNFNISTSLNYNYSDIGRDDSNAYGGALDLSKAFFDNKLNTTFGITYNTNNNQDVTTDVLNFRTNASTTIAEKHNFNLNAVQLFSSSTAQDPLNEITVTFGYTYIFDIGNPLKKKKRKKLIEAEDAEEMEKPKSLRFSHKEHRFNGTPSEISPQIIEIASDAKFKSVFEVEFFKNKLSELERVLSESETISPKEYRENAITYLDYLYSCNDFSQQYYAIALSSLRRLYKDAIVLSGSIEDEYQNIRAEVNTLRSNKEQVSDQLQKDLETKTQKYNAHSWMLKQLKTLTANDVQSNKGLLNEFRNKELLNVYEAINNGNTKKSIELYLVERFADFYHRKSLEGLKF